VRRHMSCRQTCRDPSRTSPWPSGRRLSLRNDTFSRRRFRLTSSTLSYPRRYTVALHNGMSCRRTSRQR